MKVLVIGKGGREHALVWKLAQSSRVTDVFCAPGNAGTARDGQNIPYEASEFEKLSQFARKEQVSLTVVGPEDPLTTGIVDHFKKHKLRIFGPSKAAAQIEGSKVFAKALMRQTDVPTADFVTFDHPDPARNYIKTREVVDLHDGRFATFPFDGFKVVVEDGAKYLVIDTRKLKVSPPESLVVKADGLAAGKGVFGCSTTEEALAAVERIMVREEFGRNAGRQIIIEKRLDGDERSLLALVSGKSIYPLPPTRDFKRLQDGDRGPNTGGMGAVCPSPLSAEDNEMIDRDIVVPIIHGLRQRNAEFSGVLYTGLMLTSQGPRVLEFNCRFGDPETQPLLMRLKSDLYDVLAAAADGRLADAFPEGLEWDPRPAVCVVMASGGYPGTFTKGHPITGLDKAETIVDVKVFHAGTKIDGGRVVNDGGRVLGVTALGDTLDDARRKAYEACACITFRDAHYRKDIGSYTPPPPKWRE